MKRPTLPRSSHVAALVAFLSFCPLPDSQAQDQAPAPSTSRGENFSAKPAAQLFASDCTGAGCHKGPQGLAKRLGLANFLREHYTNSRESAAALANYLTNIPRGPEPRTPRSGKPAVAAPAAGTPGLGDSVAPAPHEARAPRHTPAGRTSRASARPDDDPAGLVPPAPIPVPPAAAPPAAEPPPARAPRVRQPAAAAAMAPSPPPAPPETEAAPAPAPPPSPAASPPAPKQFDIFD